MLTNYIPVVAAVLIAIGIAVGMLALSHILGLLEARRKRAKLVAYECGNEPLGDARQRFPVKFYFIAMLFIIFDIEIVFFYPWALIRHELGMLGFWAMVIFIGILVIGYIYLLRVGGFEWEWWEREEPIGKLTTVREINEIETQTVEVAVTPSGGEKQ